MSAHLPERSLQFPSMCKDGYRLLAVRGHTWCIRKPRQVLKIFQQNIRSILWKFNKIITLIESCNITFDALTFTETWNGENSDNFILPHYNRLFKLEKKKTLGATESLDRLLYQASICYMNSALLPVIFKSFVLRKTRMCSLCCTDHRAAISWHF